MVRKKDFMQALGERIKRARIKAGYTQEQLAEILNLSRGTIARYELGEIEPKIQNLASIAEVLHVSADYLMGLPYNEAHLSEELSPKAIHALEDFIREIRKNEG